MTAGKWGYTMAVTIQNERLREGELRFALQLVLVWGILAGCCVAALLIGRWGEPIDAQDWWTLAALVGVVTLIPILGFVVVPRQLIRLTDSAIDLVNIRRGRRRRTIRIPWSDVEECVVGSRGAGIAAHGKRRWLGNFAKEDWALLRAELEARLTPYFDFDAPTRCDLRRQRQRAWSIRRKILDKLAVVACGLGICGIPLLLLIAWFVWWPIAIAVCMLVMVASAVIAIRFGHPRKYDRWHERRVEPSG